MGPLLKSLPRYQANRVLGVCVKLPARIEACSGISLTLHRATNGYPENIKKEIKKLA